MSNLYELIELPDGEIVLQRLGGEGEPLVQIRFSQPARAFMGGTSLDVARAMVEAGVAALSAIGQERVAEAIVEEPDEEPDEPQPRTHLLH